MLPYVVWKDGEEKKYCVVAEDSDRAKRLVTRSIADGDALVVVYKSMRVRPASEDDMRNRVLKVRGSWGWITRSNYWDRYQNMKLKNKEGIIGSYYF